MPYLHLTSTALPLETKRRLARDLTAATLRALGLPEEHRFRTTVHFAAVAPEDIAIGGTLWSDGGEPDYFLQLTDYDLTREKEAALVRELLAAMVEVLGLGPQGAFKVNIKFDHYRAEGFAIGGIFLPQLHARRGTPP